MFPTKIENYEISEQIGGNERGAVYKARDTESNRDVAVKLLEAQSLFTLTTQKKFTQQMEKLKALSHPALLPLLAFGSQDNRPFIVMPLMVENLSARISGQQMDVGNALQICGQIGDALDYAATNGVYHLDMKPNNVLFDDHGHPFVADLGLVQVINSLSAANTPQINPYYMSPEQVRRRPLTAPSHVYSLAAILFQMLTGQTLFTGASELVASFKHTSEKPRGVRTLRSDLTKGFDAVMARGLEKRPEERYPSCRTFVQQLVAAQGGAISPEEVRAQDFSTPAQRTPQALQRRPPLSAVRQISPDQASQLQKRVATGVVLLGVGMSFCIALAVLLAILLGQ